MSQRVPCQVYLCPHEGSAWNHTEVLTLKAWLRCMRQVENQPLYVVKLKPPPYWFRMKEDSGVAPGGVNRMWNLYYKREKQLITWASAPFEDFEAVGYGMTRWATTDTTWYQIWQEAQER